MSDDVTTPPISDCPCNICAEYGPLPTLTYEQGVARAENDARIRDFVRAARASNTRRVKGAP